MTTLTSAANPFALLLDPQTVLASIERSERLVRLHSRICRPLDKPLLPAGGKAQATKAFDREIDDDVSDDLN
ncbi:hypothetical protein [Aquabacterium sp.]|uniref:hypothetical protein n=1 Tax=Aquabacterium sp. TaxID=1872578 RepID=UPI002B91114C|nr:hypothetical protein [Aquabacterium sp.]HSW09144.1 hypothetical protein [Aquabacterium sp.]